MKKLTNYLSFIILLISINFQKVATQCNPVLRESCDDASSNVLCGLTMLNGYACSNYSTVPSECSPICSQGGTSNNTSWWGFATDGGNVTITLSVGGCSNSLGLEFGVWGNCQCGEEIVCQSNPCTLPGTTKSVSFNTTPCKPYYLWIDGCNGDVCDFTINTIGGGPPTISPLSKINNKANMIIDVCEGACFTFFVNPPTGGCQPTYKWTWDGVVLSDLTSRSFETDVTEPVGDYTICVTAYISLKAGSICTQQGPQCATVKIRRIPGKVGLPRVLCLEQTNSGGYKWHSQKIVNSGIYNEQFTDANCCKFDSTVEFTVLESPFPENVYYITCDNKPYIDIAGKKHPPCLFQNQVFLPKTTEQYKCDSSIVLTAINVDFAPTWNIQCFGGMVELIPNINLLKACNAGETYEFEYKWFKKSDPKDIISTDERLLVNSVSEEYCLEVKVRTALEEENAVCTKVFCESFNEGGSIPDCSFALDGNKIFCFDAIGTYWVDQLIPKNVNFYTWTIDGGFIVSNPDSPVVDIKWLLRPADTGRVCVSYDTDCGTSCEKCLTVLFQTKIAGEDFEHRGLSAYLDAKPNPNGMWRLISGPHQVRIEDPTFARTKITAFNYGYYCFEWTINDPNCVMKDTLCIDLHSFKRASPEYPKSLFNERSGSISDQSQLPSIIFTPNLIESTGETYVSINGDINSKLNYHWFDIYGRVVTQHEISFESGIQKLNIHSPIYGGM